MIKIDETNFPDVYFRMYLWGQNYGRHGVIMDEDIPKITYISVSDDIKSLKGIEHFTALTTLFCEDNQLTTLDVSKNVALRVLDCSNNLLTELDLTKNTALDDLNVAIIG